jgi:hypothetical protein
MAETAPSGLRTPGLTPRSGPCAAPGRGWATAAPHTTLILTLAPCHMGAAGPGPCPGAPSRVPHYGPEDGACGSVFDLRPCESRFNRAVEATGGILAEVCAERLRAFLHGRRGQSASAKGCMRNEREGAGRPRPSSSK